MTMLCAWPGCVLGVGAALPVLPVAVTVSMHLLFLLGLGVRGEAVPESTAAFCPPRDGQGHLLRAPRMAFPCEVILLGSPGSGASAASRWRPHCPGQLALGAGQVR